MVIHVSELAKTASRARRNISDATDIAFFSAI